MRKLVVLFVFVTALLVPTRADAATVTFGVSLATWLPGTCAVDVPQGADGIDVLDAAQDEGCILSYETVDTSFGPYLKCVNGICDSVATYWCLYYDGEPAHVGLTGFDAGTNDELVVSYQQFLAPTSPVGCF